MKRMLRIGLVLLAMLLGSGLADTSLFGTMALAKHDGGNGPGGKGNGWGWGHEAMKGHGAPPAWSRSNRPGKSWWRREKDWNPPWRSVPVHRRVRRGWDKKAKHHAYGHRRRRPRSWRSRYWRSRSYRRWPRKRYHWPRPIA